MLDSTSCHSRRPATSWEHLRSIVLLEAIHVRDEYGRWSVADDACIRIGLEVPVLRPLAILAGLSVMRGIRELVYALVAGHRHQLSRLLGDDACQIERRPR